MNPIFKCARLSVLLVAVLGPATQAFGDATVIPRYDISTPGSVIVFPKFINAPGVIGFPRTEVRVEAVCPHTTPNGIVVSGVCAEGQLVKVRFHWVCPGAQDALASFACKTAGFDLILSVNGNVSFTADGLPVADDVFVPAPPCQRGYLIGWAVDAFDRPVKFDGLIGNAILRNMDATAFSIYSAITIQATLREQPNFVFGFDTPGGASAIATTSTGALSFSGGVVAKNDYEAVTDLLYGGVNFDPQPMAGGDSGTSLILLTLDVVSNRPNLPTFVPLRFSNRFGDSLGTFVEFLCWGEFELTADIDDNLTQAFQGSRRGTVIAGPAKKFPFAGIHDAPLDSLGRDTLLGLVETTTEGASMMYNNGDPIGTLFTP